MDFRDFEKDVVAKAKSVEIPNMEWKDIAQEFRLAIYQNQDRYNPKLASERTFAVRIMSNKLVDLMRKARIVARKPKKKTKK